VRVIHTADLHLGTTTYGTEDPSTGLNRRIQDFFAAFDQCVDYAINKKADALFLCGDTFKDISPSSTLLKMFASRIHRLTSEKIRVLMLLGNHDSPKTVGRAAPLEVFDELKLPGVHIFSKPDIHDITSRDGVKFRVFALPYRHPIHIAAKIDKTKARKVELNTNELLVAFQAEIKRNIEIFTKTRKEGAQIGILAAHLLVEGARRGAESVYIVGAEFVVPLRMLLSEAFDFIALGHVHSHQTLASKVPTVYAGSLERIDFSETDENKGFVDITYEDGALEWNFIPVETRPMIKLEVDCTKAEDITKLVTGRIEKTPVKDAIVKLVLKIKPETHIDLDIIHEKLALSFWHQINFEKIDVRPVQAVNSWQSLNPHETLAHYLKASKLSEEDKIFVGKLGDEIVDEVLSEAGKA
jgi:exonuclease SbcD